jgi:hypothetical protein
LRLILCRVWQGTFMLKYLAEITAVDPTAAGGAFDEMLGLALGLMAHSSPEDCSAGDHFVPTPNSRIRVCCITVTGPMPARKLVRSKAQTAGGFLDWQIDVPATGDVG